MSLECAITATLNLKNALAEELDLAETLRSLLSTLDASGLFELAAKREAFNARVQFLTGQMHAALADAAKMLELQEVTIETLRAKAPESTAPLATALAEVRSLAGALSRTDALNRNLTERVLACVRAYTSNLSPRAAAYDRWGARATTDVPTCSQRA